jgi:hypothetical protein
MAAGSGFNKPLHLITQSRGTLHKHRFACLHAPLTEIVILGFNRKSSDRIESPSSFFVGAICKKGYKIGNEERKYD